MARHLPILTFHDIASDGAVISTDPALFADGLERLHARGFTTLRLAEAARRLRAGAPIPERTFVITFDDGYDSLHRHALPVLTRLGFTATVFATIGESLAGSRGPSRPTLEGKPLLVRSQVLELRDAGIEFGAHTLTHPDLTRLAPDRLREEMLGSQALLEEALGSSVRSFAYPFGRFDARSRALASEHFDCACSDALGFATSASDLYALERIDAYYLRTPASYGRIDRAWLRAYIRARNVPRRLRRARRAGADATRVGPRREP